MSATIKFSCLGFRPPTKLHPWKWAEQYVKIQNSERSNSFDCSQTPWWQAPLECAADYDTRQVVVIAPTGSGKTTLAEALIPFVVSENPGNFLYASQTDTDAKFWAETRLLPTLKSCEPCAALFPDDRSSARKMEIIFSHMALVLGGANLSNFQEKSCRWLYGDEVWRWNHGLVREFMARHHNRWNRKVYLVSQGGFEGSELDQEWKKSDMSEFGWKCKSCKTEQAYSWDFLRFDLISVDDHVDEQASSRTAKMECKNCRATFADTVSIRRELASSNVKNGNGGYLKTNTGLDGIRGFHVDSLAVWWIPWSAEVLGFLEARRMLKSGVVDNFRQWWQKRRAKFWAEDLADDHKEIEVGAYSKMENEFADTIEGETIIGMGEHARPARFMTVDVQGFHFWAIVQSWTAGGGSKILWEGFIQGDGADEIGICEIQERYKIKPYDVWLDIGYDQPRVFNLLAKHGWRGIKGDGIRRSYTHVNKQGKKIERLFSKTTRARSTSGAIVQFVFIATNPVKDIASRLLSGDGARFEVPSDVSPAFKKHVRAERREMSKQRKTGQEESIWVTKSKENHLWDCLVYQVGVACIYRLFEGGDE